MRRRIALVLALCALTCPHGATATERDPLALPLGGRPIADWLSTAAVATNIVAELVTNSHSDNARQALACQAFRTGIIVGGIELTKHFIHRSRPDGSDRKSFPSEHTALAEVNSGWRFGTAVSIGVGAGRMMAAKHHASDVTVGFGAGWLSRKVGCR